MYFLFVAANTNLVPTNNVDVIEVFLDNETCDLEFQSDVDASGKYRYNSYIATYNYVYLYVS